MDKKIPCSFQTEILTVEQISDQISKARVRLFYLGKNRNGSYISEEFANKLLTSLPYTPLVGIYDSEKQDFTSHSFDSGEAQIYGLVPQEPNLSLEENEDSDGVIRQYYCSDVYIYTKRFKEANEIVGKPQSMELDPDSINGSWKMIDGEMYFVFESADFLGLSVLGEDIEPCFEGAAFYELVQKFSLAMEGRKEKMDEKFEEKLEEQIEDSTTEVEVEVSEPETESELESEPATEEKILIEITPEEKAILDELGISAGEIFSDYKEMKKKVSKCAELTEQLDTISKDYEDLKAKYEELSNKQKDYELKEKKELVNRYSKIVNKETIDSLNLDAMSLDEIEKELLFSMREKVFSGNYSLISADDDEKEIEEDGAIALLRKQTQK